MTDERSIFEKFAQQQGWNDATQVELLLQYIEAQGEISGFRDFLQECADEENSNEVTI
jgi:hypothetical protein